MISARIAAQFEGRWRQGYVRGKLRSDPVFAVACALLKDSLHPVLDVGCGLGLFGFYLRQRGAAAAVHGIDFDEAKIAAARGVALRHYSGVTFAAADALSAAADFRGHILLLDVLHYLPRDHQPALLDRLAAQVAPGALCLIRATPRDAHWRFCCTQIEELFLRASRWMKSRALHYATRDDILAPFRTRGFACEVRPLWGRTPFNSHLFILRAPH